ncbi:response regulator transcription factor [Hespellia stercorisuis]|uniref:Stage 0 sporulation protein A homolog n=1 Tax=Hespellia stercorisuis DSM 15480 TaxID=1121950 RepID=A0A1M6JZ58_9FIRM|nr:response regulator [Hespellia stercorisuis]SHJ52000.1 Helix-turn-helix domain-containing protein [Hespellia stercorisuis DSM 15480]
MYRVMLVEDDRTVRYVYSRMREWEKQGFTIECEAANGSQAVEMLRTHSVDIIFTDIRMPLMNGIEMMKQMKELYPGMLFVLISSYNEFEYAREGLKLGALDYITKPMEEKDLLEVLERAKVILDDASEGGMLQKLIMISKNEVNEEDSLLANLCGYLEEHLSENLTMEDVAEYLNMNRDYLGKQLKLRTGYTFRNLYNSLKMEYAKDLIHESSQKIYEISDSLGYTSADYFSQLFKKSVGMTPAEYKRGRE